MFRSLRLLHKRRSTQALGPIERLMAHKVLTLDFTSVIPDGWDGFPNPEKFRREIGLAVLAHSEIADEVLGMYRPPDEIREVHITAAAFDQVRCMWHGHRERGRGSPPSIPLKVFVCGFGQKSGHTWANIEVLPGMDNWDVE